MTPTLALLMRIKRAPGMFLGEPSLKRLASFLRGYQMGQQDCRSEGHDGLLVAFRDWVLAGSREVGVGWEEAILRDLDADEDDRSNDGAAYEHFWQYLERFLESEPGARFVSGDNGVASVVHDVRTRSTT